MRLFLLPFAGQFPHSSAMPNMKQGPRKLAFCLLLLVVRSAQAADAAASMQAAAIELSYLQPGAINSISLLPAPPSPGSDEHKAEIDQLLVLQASRTPLQINRFLSEEKLELAGFAPVMPEFFTSENL